MLSVSPTARLPSISNRVADDEPLDARITAGKESLRRRPLFDVVPCEEQLPQVVRGITVAFERSGERVARTTTANKARPRSKYAGRIGDPDPGEADPHHHEWRRRRREQEDPRHRRPGHAPRDHCCDQQRQRDEARDRSGTRRERKVHDERQSLLGVLQMTERARRWNHHGVQPNGGAASDDREHAEPPIEPRWLLPLRHRLTSPYHVVVVATGMGR